MNRKFCYIDTNIRNKFTCISNNDLPGCFRGSLGVENSLWVVKFYFTPRTNKTPNTFHMTVTVGKKMADLTKITSLRGKNQITHTRNLFFVCDILQVTIWRMYNKLNFRLTSYSIYSCELLKLQIVF